MTPILVFLFSLGIRAIRAVCQTRSELVLENLALRHQVAALQKQRPRPVLDDTDRAFWVALRQSWSRWVNHLIIVDPDTVAKWHRERFRRYWTTISRPHRGPGRPRVDADIRRLIEQMAQDGWGAPRGSMAN